MMKIKHLSHNMLLRFLLLILASLPFNPAWAGDAKALGLLNNMMQAMQEKSYHGKFVYLSGDKLESMVFVHRKQGDTVRERLYSLNGEAREILRNNDALICILPKTEAILVDNSVIDSQLPVQLPMNLEQLSDSYEFKVIGEERIADLNTVIVSIQPKDSYRYGYRYWVDKSSDLLVKTTVINESGAQIEQMMFTELNIEPVDDELLEPVSKSGDFRKHESTPQISAVNPKVADSYWRVRMLPHGFSLTMHQRKLKPKVVEHLIFSDGMSSLSVFIEKKSDKEALTGHSNMGAINAFGRFADKYHITAVGEVPSQTVRLIGEAMSIEDQ